MWEKMKIVMSSVFEFVLPFLRQLMTASGPILAQAAITAVTTVAANAAGSTDSTKRDLAFQMIANELKKKGIEIGVQVSTSLVNAALETAVLRMKAAAPK